MVGPGAFMAHPIDMQFVEPCFVVSTIGLAAPGEIIRGVRAKDCDKHLRQVHACIPAKDGSTRLLYLMHLDFWPFLKKLPGMEAMWASQASQVLGEDLRLVEGRLGEKGDLVDVLMVRQDEGGRPTSTVAVTRAMSVSPL